MKKARPSDSSFKKFRENIFTRDVFGRTVLHMAVLCDQPDLMSQILRIPEAKLIILATDCENGWNVLHYILYYKRLRCLVVLLEYLSKNYTGNHSTLHELLKRKDRCGTPPVFLLKNDVKDFVWIPTYLNENNEFHLEYRYLDQNKEDPNKQKMRRSWQLDHIMWNRNRGGSDLYVMGSNANHSLGVGDSTDRSVPVKLSSFTFQKPHHDLKLYIRKPRYRDVRISKYHSVALTTDGAVFSCGLGSKGRLGNGTSRDCFKFTKVGFFESQKKVVTQIAISTGHNLALTSSNELYAWGLNSYHQLGFAISETTLYKGPKDFQSTPSMVLSGEFRKLTKPIVGIAASKIHSVAYTRDTVYMWGLNVGQMGIESSERADHNCNINGTVLKGSIVESPRATFKEQIKLLATCETCTCVVTEANDVFVFYGYHRIKLPKLPSRSDFKNFDAYKPSRLTAPPKIRKMVMKAPEKVFILLESGDVMSFSISPTFDMKSSKNLKFSYLWKAYDSNLRAVDIDNSYDGLIVLCTRDGSVFTRGTQSIESQQRSLGSIVPSISMASKLKFRRLEGVNKVVHVACDELFSSFCFIRDEIDIPPLKLQKNNFRVDLAYLSPLSDLDSFRKQDQLLDTDHDINCYVSDFVLPAMPEISENGDLRLSQFEQTFDEEETQKEASRSDRLVQKHDLRYKFSKGTISFDNIYQSVEESEQAKLSAVLSNEKAAKDLLMANTLEKFYDGTISFRSEPHLRIGFHESLLACRSKFFHRIAHQESSDEFFLFEGIKGNYDAEHRILTFDSDVDFRAVLVLLHFVYTNEVLNFWEAFPLGSSCPPAIKRTREEFSRLMSLFQLDPFHGRDEKFVALFLGCWNDERRGDVLVILRDGEIRCDSSMLVARSAFFETFLSERWDTTHDDSSEESVEEAKVINLEGITTLQFEVILRHIYGTSDLDVFDDVYHSISAENDSDEFINFLLDLIEIADELLLIQLKHLCELAIKDLISIDNCLLLITHAFYLSAPKLFKCCCWCIFNNLDVLLFDPASKELDFEILAALEKELRYLQLMKQGDFVIGDHGEINLKLLKSLNGPLPELANIPDFGRPLNDVFMTEDLQFKPAFDHTPEALGGTEEKKRRSSSRRLSRRDSTTELQREMRALQIQLDIRRPSDSAVIDDVHHEESGFEYVSSRRRHKARSSFASQAVTSDTENARSNSLNGIKSQSTTPPPPAATPVNKAASFEFSSGNSSTSSFAQMPLGPTLGESGLHNTKVRPKVKFSANKKSQKERKRLGSDAQNGNSSGANSPPVFANPWKTDSSLAEVKEDEKVKALPALGSWGEVSTASTSSLRAIMLEELMKIEDQKYAESQRMSLQEVQQEQEFAKWWEEESRRVQQEMRGPVGKSSGLNGNSQRGSRASRKPKKEGKKKAPAKPTK